ncbi:MAG: beta-ketoacyl-[acyl-carrier-protein] synthase II, partial [Cyanobacteria bacterium P01_H01_bin.119]
AVLALRHSTVPPTINVESLDPACPLNYTLGAADQSPLTIAMSNGFGFGGHNTTVVFGTL